MSIPASEEFKLTAIRDMREGDIIIIIIDPADEVGPSGNFYRLRAGTMWLDWVPGSRQFYSCRPPKEE